jgi:hypothetical protein
MKKANCSVEENLGILENKIYDSQLEIEWLIKEVPHIKDPASLYEAEQRKVISSVPEKMKNQRVRKVNISTSSGIIITVVASCFSRADKKKQGTKKEKRYLSRPVSAECT